MRILKTLLASVALLLLTNTANAGDLIARYREVSPNSLQFFVEVQNRGDDPIVITGLHLNGPVGSCGKTCHPNCVMPSSTLPYRLVTGATYGFSDFHCTPLRLTVDTTTGSKELWFGELPTDTNKPNFRVRVTPLGNVYTVFYQYEDDAPITITSISLNNNSSDCTKGTGKPVHWVFGQEWQFQTLCEPVKIDIDTDRGMVTYRLTD